MQTKLQELTERIYQEGVSKANLEADTILADARKQADDLLAKASRQAEEIIKEAKKDAATLHKNSISELQLAGRQAISDLKQKIAGLVETGIVQPQTKGAFKDIAFMQELIKAVVKNWNPNQNENVELSVLLPSASKKEFEAFFKEKATDLLDRGLQLSYSEKMKSGFKVGPKDGGYMISFADEDFENFFRAYLRPKLIELLYGK